MKMTKSRLLVLISLSVALIAVARAELDASFVKTLQQQVAASACADKRFQSSADLSTSDCVDEANDVLPSCWKLIAPYIEDVSAVRESVYKRSDREKILGIHPLLVYCVQAKILVADDADGSDADAREHNFPIQDLSWWSAIELIHLNYRKDEEAISRIAERFSSSDYDSVYRQENTENILAKTNGGELQEMSSKEVEQWVDVLGTTDLRVLFKKNGTMYFHKIEPIVTTDRAFIVQYVFDDVEPHYECGRDLEPIECGACDLRIDERRSIYASWVPSRIFDYGLATAGSKASELDEYEKCRIEGMKDIEALR